METEIQKATFIKNSINEILTNYNLDSTNIEWRILFDGEGTFLVEMLPLQPNIYIESLMDDFNKINPMLNKIFGEHVIELVTKVIDEDFVSIIDEGRYIELASNRVEIGTCDFVNNKLSLMYQMQVLRKQLDQSLDRFREQLKIIIRDIVISKLSDKDCIVKYNYNTPHFGDDSNVFHHVRIFLREDEFDTIYKAMDGVEGDLNEELLSGCNEYVSISFCVSDNRFEVVTDYAKPHRHDEHEIILNKRYGIYDR